MPNLLATRTGRLAAFSLLYVTEGLPQGFAATAVATQMRRQGMSPADVGLFVATLYAPWAWKWTIGPLVDLFYSDRLGRRRAWIVGCQLMMSLTILAAWPLDLAADFKLLVAIVLIHNVFAATQDVAIDALAVTTLKEDERGLAGGLMFAGAFLGNAVGGSGALHLAAAVGFGAAFPFVAGAILAITLAVSVWLREPPTVLVAEPVEPSDAWRGDGGGVLSYERRAAGEDPEPPPPYLPPSAGRLRRLWFEIVLYVRTVVRAMLGSGPAVAGLAFALLPGGALSLSMTLGSSLSVDVGLDDKQIANLSLAGTVLAAIGCVAGGWVADRLGGRRVLAACVVLSAVPILLAARFLHQHGWDVPAAARAAGPAAPDLIRSLVAASLCYSLVLGMIYGSRTAIFLGVCDPRVAGTQFTGYMALMNVALMYSAYWQGRSASWLGYPKTMALDAAAGLVCLVPLAFMRGRKGETDRDGTPATLGRTGDVLPLPPGEGGGEGARELNRSAE